MKAVARLLVLYFGGSAPARWMTLAGLAMVGSGLACVLYYSRHVLIDSKFRVLSGAGDLLVWGLPALGMVALFLGGSLMPLVLGRLLPTRQLYLLPHGPAKLMISALLPPALVALVFAAVVSVLYAEFPLDTTTVFSKAWVVSFLCFCLMYVEIWLISKARSALGLLAGAMLVLFSMALPIQFIRLPGSSLRWPIIFGLALLGSGFLAGISRRGLRQGWAHTRWRPLNSWAAGPTPPTQARAFGLAMGFANPWLLALGPVVPFLLATRFIDSPKIWLFYLTLFSVLSGAIASLAAARSRILWLRGPWSRADLFGRVERTFWRHNSIAVGVLVLMLLGIGLPQHFSGALLGNGAVLIFLGNVSSTYLGLMMTRSIGVLDSALATVTMLLMMGVAVGAADAVAPASLAVGVVTLGLLTMLFRGMAKLRWARLDWAQCR